MTKDENGNILFDSLEEALADARALLVRAKGKSGEGARMQTEAGYRRIAELEARMKIRDEMAQVPR